MLSGDVAHSRENFDHRRVLSFKRRPRADTARSMDRVDALLRAEEAVLWINHDAAHSASIRHAPGEVR